MADLTIDFQPDGPTASWTTSAAPTRTRGETVTLDLQFRPADSAEYDSMVERLAFTDPVWTGVQADGIPWVDEDLPSSAPVTSQILDVTPGAGVGFEGFWAALVGGTDNSQPARELDRVSVELVFLADSDEYSSRSALKNDIGAVSL